jgi:glycosyltransferase involved in cell wall biosynthesis
MRVALVHDYLVQYGGAERVLDAFCELFPDAPIYTLLYDPQAMQGAFSGRDIRTSFLQRSALARRHHRLFPLLMPLAVEQFDFSQFDVVLSDSASYAKGVITSPKTLHVCYMHTPTRYVWDDCQKYMQDFGFPSFIKRWVPLFLNPVRLWDRSAARRPDAIFANSEFVRRRIAKYYRRESEVIYPPVRVQPFFEAAACARKQAYFLMVGRLIAYKRYDIVIEACNRLRLPLKIIGSGPEEKRLKQMAGDTVEFIGRVDDADLPRYYAECQAFVFPQEEDFGIVAVEAGAAGVPVIAYRGGGVVEHLEEGVTGTFFEEQTVDSVAEVLIRFDATRYDSKCIREQSRRFDTELFKRTVKEHVDRLWREYTKK